MVSRNPPEKRNYKREAANETRARKDARIDRVQARREMEKKHGKSALAGKDVDHKRALRHGGSNASSNLRLRDPSENRSWRKGKKGYD
jgi:hypothetical protein